MKGQTVGMGSQGTRSLSYASRKVSTVSTAPKTVSISGVETPVEIVENVESEPVSASRNGRNVETTEAKNGQKELVSSNVSAFQYWVSVISHQLQVSPPCQPYP